MTEIPILEQIFARKREEVRAIPSQVIRAYAANAEKTVPIFRDALLAPGLPNQLKLIAEFKRASPSKGSIYPNALVSQVIPSYEKSKAAAISVLTDSAFGGSLEDLAATRVSTGLPLLRKDFIYCKTQIDQARCYGANAILLIAAQLTSHELKGLRKHAAAYGMDALVEVHNYVDLQEALESEADLIGINNRNLRTFQTRIETTLELLPLVPKGIPVVTESGVHTYEDVQQLTLSGVYAMLVGESLMSKKTPEGIQQQIKALYGKHN